MPLQIPDTVLYHDFLNGVLVVHLATLHRLQRSLQQVETVLRGTEVHEAGANVLVSLGDEIIVFGLGEAGKGVLEQDDVGVEKEARNTHREDLVEENELQLHQDVEVVVAVVTHSCPLVLRDDLGFDEGDGETLIVEDIVGLLVQGDNHEIPISPESARHVGDVELIEVWIVHVGHHNTPIHLHSLHNVLDTVDSTIIRHFTLAETTRKRNYPIMETKRT